MRKAPGPLAGDRSICWAWARLTPLKYQLRRAGGWSPAGPDLSDPCPHTGQRPRCPAPTVFPGTRCTQGPVQGPGPRSASAPSPWCPASGAVGEGTGGPLGPATSRDLSRETLSTLLGRRFSTSPARKMTTGPGPGPPCPGEGGTRNQGPRRAVPAGLQGCMEDHEQPGQAEPTRPRGGQHG